VNVSIDRLYRGKSLQIVRGARRPIGRFRCQYWIHCKSPCGEDCACYSGGDQQRGDKFSEVEVRILHHYFSLPERLQVFIGAFPLISNRMISGFAAAGRGDANPS
jgi:hypothetical protein